MAPSNRVAGALILADMLAGVPADERAKIAGGNTARVHRFDVPKLGARRRS